MVHMAIFKFNTILYQTMSSDKSLKIGLTFGFILVFKFYYNNIQLFYSIKLYIIIIFQKYI